jgi:hopanoid-associated phosphorylase
MARHFLVVATGLLAEARVVDQAGVRAIAGGGNAMRLEAEIDSALTQGARAVLSFGLAAGLKPRLAPGTLVIPSLIVCGQHRYPTDPQWSQNLRKALAEFVALPIAGVDAPLIRATDKVQLHAASGAVAADMESHVAARLAARAGRPFAALRVISDPAERALPHAAVVGMRSDGAVNLVAVVASLLRHPGQLPELARIATDVRCAMQVLTRCRRLLGPELGLETP